MKPSKNASPLWKISVGFLGALLLLSACLTLNVNVNFPESAVQQATDNYVHDLYKQKEKGRPAKKSTETEKGTANHSQLSWSLMASAYADGPAPSFQINSAKAVKIRERLAAWVGEVVAQKRTGVLGESADGKLIVRSPEKLKGLLSAKVNQVVTEENKLREELYNEVITSNQMSKERLVDVRKSFSHSFQAESPAGTWIEDAPGKWTQKE